MSQFFEKNKRKGLVALLFLFQEKKKSRVPIALLVVAGATAVMLAPSLQSRLGEGSALSRALSLAGLGSAGAGGGRGFFASKESAPPSPGRAGLNGSTGPGSSAATGSSMNMLRGSVEVLKTPVPDPGKLGGKSVRNVRGPQSPGGVPTPVALTEDDIRCGLTRPDAGEVVRTGQAAGCPEARRPAGGAEPAAPGGRILLADAAGFSGAQVLSQGPGGMVQWMVESAQKGRRGGGQVGRLDPFSYQKGVRIINAWNSGQGPGCDQTQDPLCELVVARAYSKAGSQNLTSCLNCPKEPGAHMAGASFDGKNRQQTGLVTSPEEGAPVDNGGYVNARMVEGDQLNWKINQCDDLVATQSVQQGEAAKLMSSLGERVKLWYQTTSVVEGVSSACQPYCPVQCTSFLPKDPASYAACLACGTPCAAASFLKQQLQIEMGNYASALQQFKQIAQSDSQACTNLFRGDSDPGVLTSQEQKQIDTALTW